MQNKLKTPGYRPNPWKMKTKANADVASHSDSISQLAAVLGIKYSVS